MRSMSSRRWLPVATVALVAGALLAGTAASANGRGDGNSPARSPAMIKQSKKESGLVFYANAPASNLKVVTDRFQYYHPWIKTTAYDLDNNVIFSKYASEAAQGTRTADLLISSAPNLWVYATRQKFLVDYDPLQLSAFPKFAKQYKGVFIISPDPAIIMYNKLLLKDKVPQSLTQMANDPGTYGKLTGYTVDNLFGYTGLWGYVQKKGWVEPREDRQGQVHGADRSRRSAVARLAGCIAGGVSHLADRSARHRNSPALSKILDWTYNKDATPLFPAGWVSPTKAASPASAKLFLNWLFTRPASRRCAMPASRRSATASRRRAAVTRSPTSTPRSGGRTRSVPYSQKFVNDYPAYKKRWHGIFG